MKISSRVRIGNIGFFMRAIRPRWLWNHDHVVLTFFPFLVKIVAAKDARALVPESLNIDRIITPLHDLEKNMFLKLV